MLKCACFNVSIKTTNEAKNSNRKQSEKLDNSVANLINLFVEDDEAADGVKQQQVEEKADMVKLVNDKFLNAALILSTVEPVKAIKTNQSFFDLEHSQDANSTNFEWIDSNVLIEYPMLIGFKKKELSNLNKSFLKFYKCLICNKYTHCVIALNESKSNKSIHQSNMSLDDKCESINSNINEQLMMSGSFTNRTNASSITSHSSKSDSSDNYNITIIANTADLISDQEKIDALKKSKNYSHTYGVVLNIEQQDEFPNISDINKQIHMESLFEQEKFLQQIKEAFKNHMKQKKPDDEEDEAKFKSNFQNLVNKLINEEKLNSAKAISSQKTHSDPCQKNQSILKNKIKSEKRRTKNDSVNMLSSSVFELEEDDENVGKYYPTDDEEEEEEDDEMDNNNLSDNENKMSTGSSQIKHVLTKRNSNVSESTLLINRQTKTDSKYSCSLPRDIPFMTNNRFNKKQDSQQQQQQQQQQNENNYKENKSRSILMNSFRSEGEFLKRIPSVDLDGVNDDDPFDDEFDEAPENMGKAISNLASSIVLKDGRELFGGVPSRRVPINSISRSCFD